MALLYSAHLNDNWLNSVIHKVHKTFSEFGRGYSKNVQALVFSTKKNIFKNQTSYQNRIINTVKKKEAMKDKRLISYIYSF